MGVDSEHRSYERPYWRYVPTLICRGTCEYADTRSISTAHGNTSKNRGNPSIFFISRTYTGAHANTTTYVDTCASGLGCRLSNHAINTHLNTGS